MAVISFRCWILLSLDHKDRSCIPGHFDPIIQPMTDNPTDFHRVAYKWDVLPQAPGNLRIHKEILQFLGAPKSQRLKSVSCLPMAKMDGPCDSLRIQGGVEGGMKIAPVIQDFLSAPLGKA